MLLNGLICVYILFDEKKNGPSPDWARTDLLASHPAAITKSCRVCTGLFLGEN